MRLGTQISPRRFHSSNKVWTMEGGTEDNWLHTYDHVIEDEVAGQVPAVTSVFVPTPTQRALIADGHNIALTVLGGQPPVMVHITDEPLGKAPAVED